MLPTYYRGCWHVVSRSFFFGYRHYLSRRKSFTPRGASSLTRRRCIRLSSIVQDSPLLPPVGVWPVFQCQCGREPSQAGYRSSPWWAITPPTSIISRGLLFQRLAAFQSSLKKTAYAVLSPVSRRYSPLKGRSSTCYSPVRHFTQGLLPFLVRLACVKRAASVDSEPGSNSRLNRLGQSTFALRTPLRDRSGYSSIITDVFDRFDLKLKY